MTREAAVLGIPTISVYQDSLLAVDRYLIEAERMIHKTEITAGFVEDFINSHRGIPPSSDLLDKGYAAYKLIIKTLLQYNSAACK